MDFKHYGDGSFRLYFRVNSFLEGEYFRLVNTLMEKSLLANFDSFDTNLIRDRLRSQGNSSKD
jgi:hypothetical protein